MKKSLLAAACAGLLAASVGHAGNGTQPFKCTVDPGPGKDPVSFQLDETSASSQQIDLGGGVALECDFTPASNDGKPMPDTAECAFWQQFTDVRARIAATSVSRDATERLKASLSVGVNADQQDKAGLFNVTCGE